MRVKCMKLSRISNYFNQDDIKLADLFFIRDDWPDGHESRKVSEKTVWTTDEDKRILSCYKGRRNKGSRPFVS